MIKGTAPSRTFRGVLPYFASTGPSWQSVYSTNARQLHRHAASVIKQRMDVHHTPGRSLGVVMVVVSIVGERERRNELESGGNPPTPFFFFFFFF